MQQDHGNKVRAGVFMNNKLRAHGGADDFSAHREFSRRNRDKAHDPAVFILK